jgi:hypothetical protein
MHAIQPCGTFDRQEESLRSAASRIAAAALMLISAFAVTGCDKHSAPSQVPVEGKSETTGLRVLEGSAALLQTQAPISAINTYLDGFHFTSGRLQDQMEAHHYCSVLSEELIQCVIYDGNVKDAKLMGVEYVISSRLFETLPDAEKALWHSHRHEILSGQLIAPGVPEVAERALMTRLVSTYGKTWHTWHTDRHKELPLGVPQLMMGFTADGQVNADMVTARDKRFGIDSAEKKKDRESIRAPEIAEGADAWQRGKVMQIADPTGQEHASPEGAQNNPGATVSRPAK